MSFDQIHQTLPLSGLGLMVSFKFFSLYRVDKNNRGIDYNLGFWELNGSLPCDADLFLFERVELMFRIFAGGKYSYEFSRVGQEVGLLFKISQNPAHVFVQYYHGYCEYLLEFYRKQIAFRYGFLFYL